MKDIGTSSAPIPLHHPDRRHPDGSRGGVAARRQCHRRRARRQRNRVVGAGAGSGEGHSSVAPLLRRAVIERLKEIRAERVGVIGLAGLVRAPEGVVPWGTFEKIRQALPTVKFKNATDLIQEVRALKSGEEIAFIEKAADIIGKAIDALIAHVGSACAKMN